MKTKRKYKKDEKGFRKPIHPGTREPNRQDPIPNAVMLVSSN
jgi:hypothetical protein